MVGKDKFNDEFDKKAKKAFPAQIHMLSGCQDIHTSGDVTNVGRFKLPSAQDQAGGACTAALLRMLYAARESACDQDLSWVRLLRSMKQNLKAKGIDHIPQLTSSRLTDVNMPCVFVNPDHPRGTKRAVLIGINYSGQEGELAGCHNDVRNMKVYLETIHLFKPEHILILMDDGIHSPPTKRNIMNAYDGLARQTKAGDTVFCQYVGHGGRVQNKADGFDGTLIPIDFRTSGHISGDDILQELIKPMPSGAFVTYLMDCCHSGTVLNLPYRFTADGDDAVRIERDKNIDFDNLLGGVVYCCFGFFECMVRGDSRVS
mmetsp:Transcript_29561/g.35154  ORF Transcript_29561/g.35154 Transcript_29561/m.35154 type:complete len:316 (+) Transcript_29561:196-1143(+)|eukprot:CAMPEP_0198268964 /NCGR_PEP_ID=MMETSP1447-20131203/39505_1 /TAXON_ID=420782 /ORGANISM="Chaetoceros dichaeta, Strain CCMP1751" /LENGTH=315 /DNA_ID=CAMNT_0043960293 /DNA_START=237 /DNA_END=1184 /DNA_ORIENTATION=-